jgi:hypothetical protein
MKRLITLILCSVFALNLTAQTDTTKVGTKNKNVVTVIENGEKVQVKVGNEKGVEVITDEWGDTTHIRIGRRTFDVVEDWEGTRISVNKEPRDRKWTGSFNPHWAGLEVGMNLFHETDYSMYGGDEFFSLIPGKSLSWNINFMEWAFKNERNNFGLVTGLGFRFSDYRFDEQITIEKENNNGMIVPVSLDELDNFNKSKLTISYLSAPLMLEVKTPLRMGHSRLYLAGGVIGSLHLGSHTKFKYNGNKEKSRSNFNINQFSWDITGRIGFGDFCVFANYSMTPLFQDGKGPELYPLMVGISFPNI